LVNFVNLSLLNSRLPSVFLKTLKIFLKLIVKI
jgi:hypothetical protein